MKKKLMCVCRSNPEMKKLLRIMRLTMFLTIIATLSLNASVSYSQITKLNLSYQDTDIKSILNEIEEESEFFFMYNNKDVDVVRKVDLDVNSVSIENILDELFEGTETVYDIKDRQILLYPEKKNAENEVEQQQQSVTGKVTDTTGSSLPGVTVMVKGTTNGTITDFDGNYSISDVLSSDILQFSFIGMKSQDVTVGTQTAINVTLEEETIGLDEIVAIGYGTTTRQNFTGSVSELKLEGSPQALTNSTNPLSLLSGVTTGVTLSQSGEASSTPDIQVRGQKSINGGSTPLYVVDGVIFSGGLNSIDPSSIASMQVLKDATSLAAYGSQAANGVIMITTKRGVKGKPMISVAANTTISNPNFRPDLRDGDGYIELRNARAGTTSPTWMTNLERANYEAGTPTDWYDYIIRTGVQQNYSLNVSGAGDAMDYFISSSFLDNKNFIEGDEYSRITFSAKINTQINKYISIGANMNQALNKSDGVRPSYGSAVTLSPWTEPELADGSMRKYVDGVESSTLNPLWDTYNGREQESRGNSNVMGGNIEIKLPWIDGLSYKITGSYTTNTTTTRSFTHETNFVNLSLGDAGYTTAEQDKYLDQASGYINERKVKSYVLDNILTYAKGFGDHYVNATLVYTRDSKKLDSNTVTGTNYADVGNTALGFYGLNNAKSITISALEYTLHSDVGYLARGNYSYKNTYHINTSVRRDGSSVFGADNKWGIFPAVGLAWTISNESFMKSSKDIINNFKLKASWGKNGNQSLAPYGTLSTLNIGKSGAQAYFFDDQIYFGQNINALGNSSLAWETTTSFNFGAESDLLKSRIHLELDGYKSKTTDQIFSRTIPVMGAGISEQDATMGQVDNWGVEAIINSTNIKSNDFSWTSGLTFSLNRNKLVELYGDGKDDINSSLFLGRSLGAIYDYEWIGIVQSSDTEYIAATGAKPGDAMYANIDGSEDGAITPDDRTILGYGKENFRLSFQNTVNYKNLQLYVLLNGIFSGNDYGVDSNNMAYLSSDGYNAHSTLDHPFWIEANPSETYPSVAFTDSKFNALQSYGFVRLQDVILSYTFEKQLLEKLNIKSVKVYVSGKNICFIAPKWEGSDPEVRSYSSAQLSRSFTLGMNFNF